MKQVITIILSVTLLLTLSACGARGPEPAPTAEPTLAPTAVPTAAPTAAPTPAPDFSALIPRTGNLTGEPIFPEPFKFLVLHGDGSLHYVYDNMGELLYSFAAPEYEDGTSTGGLFTEDGICCWLRLKDRTEVEPFVMFGDMALNTRWAYPENEEDEWLYGHYELASVRDKNLENRREFAEGEIDFGKLGGILKIDGGYLVVKRDYDNDFACTGPILRLDEDFNRVGRIDPERIGGNIKGVLGGKYLIGAGETGELNDLNEPVRQFDIYTLDCRLVMENVTPERMVTFCLDDELFWEAGLIMASFISDADGNYYDADLEPVDELPGYETDITERVNQAPYYYSVTLYGYDENFEGGWKVVDGAMNLPYDGVKLNDEWIFRIYTPFLAEDTMQGMWGIGDYWGG